MSLSAYKKDGGTKSVYLSGVFGRFGALRGGPLGLERGDAPLQDDDGVGQIRKT